MDKYVSVQTSEKPDIWVIYKFYKTYKNGDHEYRRYEELPFIMYKTFEDCEKKVKELNG